MKLQHRIKLRLLPVVLPIAGLFVFLHAPLVAQTPQAEEKSVKPGINTEYLKPDLDISKWLGRFEKHGREVFDQREKVLDALHLKHGQHVADIGAGTGLFSMLIANAVGPKGKVYSVDIVKDFLALINKRATEAGLKNIQTVLCTDRSTELPKYSVDMVFTSDTYHHLEYPRNTLASIRQALRPGGQLVVVDYRREPGKSPAWILGHVRAGQEEVTREIEAAGFQRVETPDFLKENYLMRFRKK
ncbi:MAG: methyltransferase domain-containing protein [Verrucomicrobia bacterium]|nr:methyltransferase domain-containing protein [Verrucomicrobiota bacterium]